MTLRPCRRRSSLRPVTWSLRHSVTFHYFVWYLDMNGDGVWKYGVDWRVFFGSSGDRPVVGDWTGR